METSWWEHVQTVMTDKDMDERGVFKSEMPQICLEFCLFHVLRTFGREITAEKQGITVGERATALDLVQDIAYTYNEEDYLRKYTALCEAVPAIVKTYYDRNWHNIRCEWVAGLKKSINFCTRTNNRIESFFSKL